MIETHAIRLRGPWECQANDGPARRVHMPAALTSIIAGQGANRLVCRRRFGCPTCLDPHEHVWLVIERPVLTGEAQLNSEPLGQLQAGEGPMEFEITTRLRERNEVVLDFEMVASRSRLPAADDLLFADVRLEIRG
jgi:hypothetical protein